jgi:hypothetical protein
MEKTMPKEAQKKRKVVDIKPSQFSLTEFQRQSLTIIAKPDQTIEDIMVPGAWATISPKVRPWDAVFVIAEDGSYVAELFVVQVSKLWVRTALIKFTDLSKEDRSEDDGADDIHFVKWRGPSSKHCVVRKSDNSVISDKHESKEDAHKSMLDYEKALAR